MAYQALHYLSLAYFVNILTLHPRHFIIHDYECICSQIQQAFPCFCAFHMTFPLLPPPNSFSSSLLTNTIHIFKPSFSCRPSPEHFVSLLCAHSTSMYATVIALIKLFCNHWVHTSSCHETTQPWGTRIMSSVFSVASAMTATVPAHSRYHHLLCINKWSYFLWSKSKVALGCIRQRLFKKRI